MRERAELGTVECSAAGTEYFSTSDEPIETSIEEESLAGSVPTSRLSL